MTISPRRQPLRWVSGFIWANALLALLIGLRYLPWVQIPDISTGVYVSIAALAQSGFLAWLVGLPLLPLALFLPRRLLMPIAVVLAVSAQALLLLDTIVYAQFRFHLSGFVLELALGAGSDVFSFSPLTWALASLAVLSITVVEALLAVWLWRRTPERGFKRGLFAWLALLLIAHGWNAWADANYDQRITSVGRHLPLYHAATAKRFMHRHGLVDAQTVRDNETARQLAQGTGPGALDYPKQPLQCAPPANKHNLLVIVVDALRWDMLDPRWMPATAAFSRNALNFTRHFSNGNATKPGIFTLFYGLPASYWDAFTAQQQPPVVIERLQALGYTTKVMASATLVSPAFDRNVFASIEDLRLHTPGDKTWQRDRRITEDWLQFTAEQEGKDAPFFGFLFYDAPHSYQVPPDYPRVEPFWETVNQLELDNDFDPEPYFNVYKTTVRFIDDQIERVLDDLKRRDLLDNTVVVITSDHGQEFNDNGLNYWGHGSNFTRYQLQVPMVIHWPGHGGGQIRYHTEHFDLAPTLMSELLGCGGTDTAHYASGENLFATPSRDWSIAHSYMNYALLTEDLQVVTYPTGAVDRLHLDMTPAPDSQLPATLVHKVLDELSRFYQ